MTADTNTDLLVGVAEHLHELGIGAWSGLDAVAVEGVGIPAIILRQLPAQPSYVICLHDYRLSADAKLTDVLLGVNIRVRSGSRSPNPPSLVAGQIFNALHALGRFRLGIGTDHELRIVDMYWNSEADIGPDTTGRPERSINYYVQLNQPGTNRE